MALKDILKKVAIGTGHTQYATDSGARNYLLMLIQEAAEEIYEELDLPGALKEITARVSTGAIIALPPFVGWVRAIKQTDEKRPWTISDMRPRYHHGSWDQEWKNFRLMGHKAIQMDISNQAPLTYQIAVANSALTVTTTGKTLDSDNTSETKTLSSTAVVGTVAFSDINAIELSAVSSYDVTVYDADNNVLAIIYNSYKNSQYVLLDVSEYPEIGDCTDGSFLMDILYKQRLIQFQNDNDVFPVQGYDNVIAAKAIEIEMLYHQGKEDRSVFWHQRSKYLLDNKQGNASGIVTHRINFAPRALTNLFRYGKRYSTRRNTFR